MKPYEQDLEVDAKGSVWITGKLAALRHTMPEGHSCTPQEVLEYGQLFAAAPEMARFLIHVAQTFYRSKIARDAARILVKAGVPVPEDPRPKFSR